MKFKTFRLLVTGAGLVLFAAGGLALVSLMSDEDARRGAPGAGATPPLLGDGPEAPGPGDPGSQPGPPPQAEPTGPSREAPPRGVTPADPDALRPLDRRVLDLVRRGISGSKVKDAFPGERWKANVYRDEGFAAPNRVKLDLDRDERWDEKWTLEGGAVLRQVSPQDDDANYPDEYVLAGDRWARQGASPSGGALDTPAPAEAPPAAGRPLRDLDRLILAKIGAGIGGTKVKDAFTSQPWKASLYQDAGFPGVNRVKLDLDRDERWDEKWTIEREGGRETVKRQVAPADDEVYSEEYRLQGGAWVVKQP